MYLDRILSHLESASTDTAFHITGKLHSYAALAQRVQAISAFLEDKEEQVIGISTADHLDTYAGIIALWLQGKTMVPLNLDQPKDRIQDILDQTGIKIILDASEKTESHSFSGGELFNSQSMTASMPLVNKAKASQSAYILFTSGSTGSPKGVPITHNALNAFTQAFFKLHLELSSSDRFMQMFELTFDLSLMCYVIPLSIGSSIYTVGDEGMKYMEIFKTLEDHEISVALMVPSVLAHLRPYFDEIDLPSMRYNLFCGEALPKDITAEWKNSVPKADIFNVYGPTEATIFCMSHLYGPDSKASNGILSIGKAMDDMSMCIVDDAGNKVANTEKGELCLAGPQLTEGYWKNPEKTGEVFLDLDGKRYYRSGDVAMQDEEGEFHYLGRVDQQVKIEGFRVELSEVEHWLRKVSSKAHVAAVVQTNELGASHIIAFIEDDGPVDEQELKERLKEKLPSYMIPKKILLRKEFPLNVNGKIDRKALKASLS